MVLEGANNIVRTTVKYCLVYFNGRRAYRKILFAQETVLLGVKIVN
jgi:hypothetical protein